MQTSYLRWVIFKFEMFGACVMVLVISIKNIFLSFCIFKKNCCVFLLIYSDVGISIFYQSKNMVRWFTFGILKSSHLTLTIIFAFKIIIKL
jgi:hypothetical protein